MKLSAEVEELLSRVCRNCGETYGKHKNGNNACPIMDEEYPLRTVGYNKNGQTFEETKEN